MTMARWGMGERIGEVREGDAHAAALGSLAASPLAPQSLLQQYALVPLREAMRPSMLAPGGMGTKIALPMYPRLALAPNPYTTNPSDDLEFGQADSPLPHFFPLFLLPQASTRTTSPRLRL